MVLMFVLFFTILKDWLTFNIQIAVYKQFGSPFIKVLGLALGTFYTLKYTRIALVAEADKAKEKTDGSSNQWTKLSRSVLYIVTPRRQVSASCKNTE